MVNQTVLLTVHEIAQFLKVSPNTVYYWVSRSELPSLRIGKHLRFDKDQILIHFRAKAEQSGKIHTCLPGVALLHSRLQSRSLKTSAGVLAETNGVSNGNP